MKCSTVLSRRSLLASAFCAAAAAATGGCVPSVSGELPDLVWGRRGLSDGRFIKPRAITIDDQDQLYVVDTTGRIQVFDTEGNYIRSWLTPEQANGRPTGLSFMPAATHPSGQDRILVADTHYYRMLVYTTDGTLLDKAVIGGTAGHGPGEFAFVTDVTSDEQGCVYIGEYNASDRIQKFDPDGQFITQWGGTGRERGQFLRPQGLIIRDGVLWVADSHNHRIQRFDVAEETPRLIDIWGQSGDGPGQYYYPYDLDIAADGSLLVVEYGNNRVQRISPDGTPIASWGGPGFAPGLLNNPWGVVVDSAGRVHVLDSSNHRVQRITMPG